MLERKPDFSRLRRTLLLEGEPDYVPLFDGVDREVKSAFLGKPVPSLKEEVEFYIAAGYDYMHLAVGLPHFMGWGSRVFSGLGAGIQTQKPLFKTRAARYSVFADTEVERTWAEEGEGNITNLVEFENFPWPTAEDFDYSPFEAVKEYLPSEMKVFATVDGWFTPVWWLMGEETFYLSLADNPELVARMFKQIGTIQLECVKKIVGFDCVGALRINDDIAYNRGLLVSPKHLREYFFPWLKEAGDISKQHDLPFIFHTDGDISEVLGDIIDAGVNALHPIQPGAMNINELKREVGDKLCLMGNIDMDVLARGTSGDVEGLVKRNLREIAPGGGYIVGSSNSVTEYIPLENYNAMCQTTLKYGSYPISL